MVRGTPDRAFEQVADPLLKNLIGRQPDPAVAGFRLQKLIGFRICKGRIGAKVTTLELAAIAGALYPVNPFNNPARALA